MRLETFVCDRDGVRLDVFLARSLTGYSRRYLKDLVKAGCVSVSGAAAEPDRRLRTGQHVVVRFAELRPEWGERFERWILSEDRDFLALNKPAGLLMHPIGSSWLKSPEVALEGEENLAGILLLRRPAIARAGAERCGLVHRLDRPTSGVLIVAKTRDAQIRLLEDFKLRRLVKIYQAIVRGRLRAPETRVEAPVRSSGGRPAKATPFGRPAQTEIRVIASSRRATLVEARPLTGRTHQIRAHLAFLGHPVAGDLEADPSRGNTDNLIPPRLMLHALSLELSHPRTLRPLDLEAPVPADFKAFWKECRRESRPENSGIA